jgi:hypothetical protein
MFNKSYQIILLNYPEGEWINDYYSTIIPMVNDVIIDDDIEIEQEKIEYLVIERHFSIRNQKVVLLVEKINETV